MANEFITPEMQDITRQRELAKLLLKQGMETGAGKMVGDRYVPTHPFEHLGRLANTWAAKSMIEESDAKQLKLAESLRKLQATEAKDILSALQGTPAQEQILSTEAKTLPAGQTMLDEMNQSTLVQAARPEVAGSRREALTRALAGQSPFAQTMSAKLMEQEFKEPKWEKVEKYDQKTGNTITGMVNVNSPNPESTFRDVAVSKPALSAKDRAELADKGIAIPFGSGSSVSGGGQGGGQATKIVGDAKYMPANLPTYQYDPTLPPATNRELQAQFNKDLQKNVKNAKDAYNTIKSVSDILGSNKPSSGRGENIITGVREFFGGGGEQSKTDAQLKVLGQKLVQQVPRFEGPQSDKDVASYQAAAGDIGNPNMPIASRMAALQILVELNKKYYPNGDWDSINLNTPNIKPNMLGGTNTYFGATVQPRKETGWRVK